MTTALEGGEGSVSRPGRSSPPGKTWYPLYRRLGGPQGRSGQVRKISPPLAFDPRTVQPVASRYTDYATRPTKRHIHAPKYKRARSRVVSYFRKKKTKTWIAIFGRKAYFTKKIHLTAPYQDRNNLTKKYKQRPIGRQSTAYINLTVIKALSTFVKCTRMDQARYAAYQLTNISLQWFSIGIWLNPQHRVQSTRAWQIILGSK